MAKPQAIASLKDRLSHHYFDGQRWFLDLFLHRHRSRLTHNELRRGRVLVALLIFATLAMAAMTLVRFATEGPTTTTLGVALGPLVVLGGLVYFVRTGNSGVSGDLLVATAIGIVLFTAFTDGGLYSRVLIWLPTLPLIAMFTGARLTAVRTTLLAVFGLLLLLASHRLGLLGSTSLDDSLAGRLGASVGAMVFVSAIAYAYEDSRRRAEEALESLSLARSDWVSMVSHELRTPLTSLYGGLKLVASGKLDDRPEQLKVLLKLSTRNTERLIFLVNDILDIERLGAGQVNLNLSTLSLQGVVEEALETQRYLADQSEIALGLAAPELPALIADYDRLLQVIQNLLSNAIKFSPQGGSVTVRLGQSSDRLWCQVEDGGPGVSAAFVDRLFERFSQQEAGTRRQSGGSGLGLFICRGLIELHGGDIGYRPNPSGGSVFYFNLPLG